MTVKRGVLRPLGRDALMGLIGFGVFFTLVYAAGMALVPPKPGAALAQPDVAVGIDLTEGPGSDPNLLEDLGAELAALEQPSAAIVSVSGVVEERLVLESAELGIYNWPTLPDTGELNPDAEGPHDLNIKYSGGQAVLSLILRDTWVGEPQTDNMDVILSLGPKSWFTHAGDCTLELVDADWIVTSVVVPGWPGGGPVGEIITPAFTGVVSCHHVAEVRSGDIASFSAVFSFLPLVDG